ncbi:MAG: AraC family transcriptional regulator [Deltaproteobacteria bacterium]
MALNQSIQKAIEYIDDQQADELDLQTIAGVAGFSLSHFYKIFLAATGFTLKEYIRSKRLTQAARELISTRRRIIDIALEAGFESQEAFTRAFSRLYGAAPSLYRKDRRELVEFEKHARFGRELELRYPLDEAGIHIEGKLIRCDEIYLVGKELYTSVLGTIEEDIIPRFWREEFIPQIPSINNIKTPNLSIGYEIHDPETDMLYHMAAVEITAPEAPAGLQVRILPPSRYAVFIPERTPTVFEYGQIVLYAYGEWLPMKGLQTAGDYSLDFNYAESYFNGYNLDNRRLEVYIPVK